jgi:hypothetical protein
MIGRQIAAAQRIRGQIRATGVSISTVRWPPVARASDRPPEAAVRFLGTVGKDKNRAHGQSPTLLTVSPVGQMAA